jgi:squalene-associated FAD-dependent desaturase
VDRDAHALAAALSGGKSLAVVGAGWAGLAAAVRATERGHGVTLFEMAPRVGGRAREVMHDGVVLDNGQHILIGAYTETLALMRTVGADPDALLLRMPLALVDPHGRGLALPAGPAVPAFVRAVLALREWTLGERLALLRATLRWRLAGFRAPAEATVADLARTLPERALRSLVEPLCVAALNTPTRHASAQVFLRVLRDALFAGPGAADLLLPRVSLSALMPEPAVVWLAARGARVVTGRRVERVVPAGDARWTVDDAAFDAVLLACSANEAARLTRQCAPAWSDVAARFDYEPIVSVYLKSRGTRWPRPMQMLPGGAPAQFAFDLGALDRSGARDGLFAFVASGARSWVERGVDATTAATLEQARAAFPAEAWREPPVSYKALTERRATFLCTPALRRPALQIAPGLAAAGDYVAGPYPATLEGAVRSAVGALRSLGL